MHKNMSLLTRVLCQMVLEFDHSIVERKNPTTSMIARDSGLEERVTRVEGKVDSLMKIMETMMERLQHL